MPDDKSPFDKLNKFLASIWGKISAFLIAVVLITSFVISVQQNLVIVSLITLGLITIILAVASFGWYTEQPKPKHLGQKKSKPTKRPLLTDGLRKGARIALSIVVIGWISWVIYFGYSYWQEQKQIAELEEKVVVLIAEIDGPDLKNYRVTEELINLVGNSLAEYDDTVIIPLTETIREQQGSDHAREIGLGRHADIVLWGYFGATETNVNLTLHIENLQPERLYMLEASNTLQSHYPIADLNSFKLQQDLGKEMSALVLFISGYVRYQASDYVNALERFDKAITQPHWADDIVNLTDALFYRGSTNFFLENYDDAIADYNKAIQLDPNLIEIYNNRGVVYTYLGQYEMAISDYTEAIRVAPPGLSCLACTYSNRGNIYVQQDLHNLAIDDYTEAISIEPKFSLAYFNRGLTYAELNRHNLAIDDYTEAISLNPYFGSAYSSLGNIYYELGQYDLAISNYKKATSIDPNEATAYLNLGHSYSVKQNFDKAITNYSEAIRINPNDASFYNYRGSIYSDQDQYEKAIEDYTSAISIDSSFATPYYFNRGLAYAELGKYSKAIDDYSIFIQNEPLFPEAYYKRGTAYANKGQYDLAIADFTETIRLADPDLFCLPCTYFLRGLSYDYQNRFIEAISDYTEAIRLDPKLNKAYYNRGLTYYKQNNFNLALADFQKALTLTDDPELIAEIEQAIESLP